MENQKAFHAENRTTIAKRLGILDSQNEIIPRASQLIKEGKLKELLRSRLISDEVRNDPKTHDDLLFLDNIMRNSVGAEKVKITEKWNAEGDRRVAIREWISKDDNTEFRTPQFNLIESYARARGLQTSKIRQVCYYKWKKVWRLFKVRWKKR